MSGRLRRFNGVGAGGLLGILDTFSDKWNDH
jgi:hypothetical protein